MKLFNTLYKRIVLAYTTLLVTSIGALGFFFISTPIGMDNILPTIIVSIALVSTVSIALAKLLIGNISHSLISIKNATSRLASGNFDQNVQLTTSNNTEELVETYNDMTNSLRQIVGDLYLDRNKLSTILDTMADGVVVIQRIFYLKSGEGLIELINVAAGNLLGLNPSGSIGKRFIDEITNRNLRNLVKQAMESSNQVQEDIELVNPPRYLSVIATPINQKDDDKVILTIHDLTRIHQVDSIRKQFVSNVSHELRSPLASMQAMVETLQNGAMEESDLAHEFLTSMHNEIDRMTQIVQELLDLSEIERTENTLELIPVDIIKLMMEIHSSFQSLAKLNHVELVTLMPKSLPHVLGEREKLRQIINNLVDNAIKFTDQGGTVTISTDLTEDAVRITVKDTGIGIHKNDQTHIFERFYRVDKSRKYRGTGLGLSIAKHLVQAHKGKLDLESEKGKGSVFTFSLSKVEVEATANQSS